MSLLHHASLNPYWLCVNYMIHINSSCLIYQPWHYEYVVSDTSYMIFLFESTVVSLFMENVHTCRLSSRVWFAILSRYTECLTIYQSRKIWIYSILTFMLQTWSQRHRQTCSWCWWTRRSSVHRSRHCRCPSHTFTSSRSFQVNCSLCGPIRALCQPETLARAWCQGERQLTDKFAWKSRAANSSVR